MHKIKMHDCNKKMIKNDLFSFFYKTFTKNDWIKELINIDSNIYFFIKEEVEELFYKRGGFLSHLDFESCYNLAVDATIRQVKKSIKKNKKCFFEIGNNDNSLIYKIVKDRVLSNFRNLFDDKRKINVLNINKWLMDSIYEVYDLEVTLWDLKKLARQDPQIIIENILKLAKNFEITFEEIEELGEKLNMNFSNIIEFDLSLQFKSLRKDNNYQLVLVFDEKEVA